MTWFSFLRALVIRQSYKSLLISLTLPLLICINRFWRPFFMEMSICSTIILNSRRLWFGFTSTQTFLNSTRWNAGAQSRRLQHQPVGSTRTKCPSPAKKTVAVASHQWAWSNGQQSFPMRLKMVLGPSRAFSSKDDVSHCHSLGFINSVCSL